MESKQKNIKKIGVYTSGGDAPGMNAAIRAVVRTALYYGLEAVGIMHGYEGMINGEMIPMDSRSVGGIIQKGGTILKTARSETFKTVEGRKMAYEQLVKHNIDALVAIGGDGTFTGASALLNEFDIPIVGIPGTIDNDLIGTDLTIGFDTAINTAIDAIDKIRDTAESHDRIFIIEVMGRDSGLIALKSGIASGAEAILIPELKTDTEDLFKKLSDVRPDKLSKIIIVAEGDEIGGHEIATHMKKRFPHFDIRLSVLGHIQRGGKPSCQDRVMASRMGVAAIEALLNGRKNVMIGIVNNNVHYTPFYNSIKHLSEADPVFIRMSNILSI